MRAVLHALFVSWTVGILLAACASTPQGGGGDPNGDDLDMGSGGGGGADLRLDSDAFWANDPPIMYCVIDGGTPPKPPGGTPECPDDKNREGCPCPTAGQVAPCWPGLRANRNLGICRDGQTVCLAGEVQNTWGRCEGYQLPQEGATSGKEACQCFSAGQWKLDNLVPCFHFYNNELIGARSSRLVGPNMTECPQAGAPPLQPLPGTWSPNTVRVDCEGQFKLCYALKAGRATDPRPTDCEVIKVCTEAFYAKVNEVQSFPALPHWVATSQAQRACAQQFIERGGYGEMSVDGLSITCDKVGPKVFNRVQYCPLDCRMNDPRPECQNCGAGGSGNF